MPHQFQGYPICMLRDELFMTFFSCHEQYSPATKFLGLCLALVIGNQDIADMKCYHINIKILKIMWSVSDSFSSFKRRFKGAYNPVRYVLTYKILTVPVAYMLEKWWYGMNMLIVVNRINCWLKTCLPSDVFRLCRDLLIGDCSIFIATAKPD